MENSPYFYSPLVRILFSLRNVAEKHKNLYEHTKRGESQIYTKTAMVGKNIYKNIENSKMQILQIRTCGKVWSVV